MGFGSIVGSIAGGLIGAGSQANANAQNLEIANNQMKFQKHMSDTSVQRRVADMKKAGINPLLSVSGASAGASTPSGASSTNQRTIDPSVFGNLLTSVANASVAEAHKKKLESETVSQESNQRKADLANAQVELQNKNLSSSERRALESHIKELKIKDAQIGNINSNTSFNESKNRAFNTDYANTPEGQKESHYSNQYGGMWKMIGQAFGKGRDSEWNNRRMDRYDSRVSGKHQEIKTNPDIVGQINKFFKGRSNARR